MTTNFQNKFQIGFEAIIDRFDTEAAASSWLLEEMNRYSKNYLNNVSDNEFVSELNDKLDMIIQVNSVSESQPWECESHISSQPAH